MIEKTGAGASSVAFAIERASASTGADFDYLMRTAARESSMDPNAKARTSSAAGLFQFIDQTWLGMVKRHGEEHGLGALADQISQTRSGRYVVADRQLRREILALRYDPEISAVMAGEFTEDSKQVLRGVLGREPNGGELYAAHFLGAGGASELIQASQRGEASAAALFPDAARANRSIFYTKGGVARSPSEVLAVLSAKHDNLEIPDGPPASAGVMVARMRPTTDTMDDVVTGGYAQAGGGRPYMDGDDTDYSSDRDIYIAAATPNAVTPFVAQLLASLDPLPETVRAAMFQSDVELRRRSDQHA